VPQPRASHVEFRCVGAQRSIVLLRQTVNSAGRNAQRLPAWYTFLDLAHAVPEIARWKRFGHELLQPSDGHRILDIGCGTGADALALARRAAPRGHVVGVDFSRYLIAIAQTRAAAHCLPVTFQQGDIHNLPFPDDHFDRTRIDRVLHFLPDPGPALREAVRVTARGGRMLLTEPDWGPLSICGGDPDLTARHPEVDLTISLGDRPVDLIKDGLDLLIRVGELEDSSFIARRLGEFDWSLCASPAYIERHGEPRAVRDLSRHRAVGYSYFGAGPLKEWDFHVDGQVVTARMASNLKVNDAEGHLTCGLQGLGLIRPPSYLAQPYLESG
jgi:SAM-dependent methyltransferase